MKTGTIIAAATAIAAALLLTACNKQKEYPALSITFGEHPDTVYNAETIKIPFKVENVSGQALTAIGSCSDDDYKVEAVITGKKGDGTMTVTAPGIITEFSVKTFSLTVTDEKNLREAKSGIMMNSVCSDMFKVEFKPGYDQLNFAPDESMDMQFVILYLGAAVPTGYSVNAEGSLRASDIRVSKGASGKDQIGNDYPSDAYTGTFKLTAGSTVTEGETKIYVKVYDDYSRWTDATIYPVIKAK